MPATTQPTLLERDGELDALRTAIEQARAGEGHTVLVEGHAGIGKSALVTAASAAAAADGMLVLRAAGSELERDFPFACLRQLFEPVLVAAAPAERGRLLAGSAAPAEWVVGPASDLDATRTRAEAGHAVLHAVYWLAANVAARAPLLLVVDDLHWADDSSLRAIDYLARRASDLSLVLLLALRPSEPGSSVALLDELRGHAEPARVVPGVLGPAAVAELVRAELPDAGDDVCRAFHEFSAGNPLYLRELLLTIAADGLATGADPVERIKQASLPTLGERVTRRMARVAPEAESLATAMAVLGTGSLGTAASLARLEPEHASRIARRLAEIEVLSSDDPFAFAHPVVRRALYDRLSGAEREAAHLAAADLLRASGAGVDVRAAHLSALTPSGSSAVATALLEAARQALTRAAPEEAIRLLRRALEEGATEPSRPKLLLELGNAEVVVRDPAAIAHLQEAFETAEDPELRVLVALSLADVLGALGSWDAAVSVLDRAKAEAVEPDLIIELEALWAVISAHDPRHAVQFERDRRRLTELSSGTSWAAHALAALLAGVAAQRGESPELVRGLADRALSGRRLLAERGGGGWAATQVVSALMHIDDNERALEVCDEIEAQGRRAGSLLGLLTGIGHRGAIFSREGDLRAAEAELRIVLGPVLESGMMLWLLTAFQHYADALLERPSLADVVDLARATDMDPAFFETYSGAMLLAFRGAVAYAEQDRESARAHLEGCGKIYSALRVGPPVSSWRSALALTLPPDERARADALVAEELELARASGVSRPEGVALRAAGMLADGDRGVELLRESVSVLEDSPARLERARSLVELGARLRRGNRRRDAREYLATGMDLAERCGADRLLERAQEELRATGARPRRVVRSGVDALTASELRAARLAAAGRTNAEIAQELFVSLKTVETHLSTTYRKLGLAGRGARERLAEVLSDSGRP